MAFKDITKYLYPNEQGQHTIKLEYKDASHRYYVRERKNFELPEDNPKAWDKASRPKGTTTLLELTLEKKGLMTWPLNMAIGELFGFYDFVGDDGTRLQGFSEEKELNEEGELVKTGRLKGTMFTPERKLIDVDLDTLWPIVDSANRNWQRRQKKGADIGSVVHDAIEHHVRHDTEELDIAATYKKLIETSEYKTESERAEAIAKIEEDTEKAKLAFSKFVEWWADVKPELVGAEELVYSKQYHVSGTFDGLIRINGKLVLADWKTSNASQSPEACMPEGINYQYFIQSAIYAMIWEEMGGDPIDDLLIVSARKDGGFTPLFASDLDVDMKAMVNWVRAVIICFRMAEKVKSKLWQRGIDAGLVKEKK
jgi:hypothetical protein